MEYGIYWNDEQYRWAGYCVPAECDFPGCNILIDRGMWYTCASHDWHYELFLNGEHIDYYRYDYEPDATEKLITSLGCGLFFCSEHINIERHSHNGIVPKGEHPKWIRHILTNDSWRPWRQDHPELVAVYRSLLV